MSAHGCSILTHMTPDIIKFNKKNVSLHQNTSLIATILENLLATILENLQFGARV